MDSPTLKKAQERTVGAVGELHALASGGGKDGAKAKKLMHWRGPAGLL